MNTFPFSISKIIVLTMLWTCWMVCGHPVFAQDSPVDIHLYLFSMEETEIRQIMKNGITRDELDALQHHIYPDNRLFTEEKPLVLSAGENTLEIPPEKKQALMDGRSQSTLVFFYKVIPTDDREEIQTGMLKSRNYILNEAGEKLRLREADWEYQAEREGYRYFDFRFANVLGHASFIYELTAEIGESSTSYQIILR